MDGSFQDLLVALKAGPNLRQAQAQLYRLVSAALLEPLRSKVPARARPRMDAEDVLHEAYLRALKKIDQIDCSSEQHFFAWVYRIARNLMSDQAKRMSARAVPFARDAASDGRAGLRESRMPARKGSPESALQRREIIERVFSRMREPEAEVIRRRWLAGQSFAEIATALRKTQKAVKGLYTRAWKSFQRLAQREG